MSTLDANCAWMLSCVFLALLALDYAQENETQKVGDPLTILKAPNGDEAPRGPTEVSNKDFEAELLQLRRTYDHLIHNLKSLFRCRSYKCSKSWHKKRAYHEYLREKIQELEDFLEQLKT